MNLFEYRKKPLNKYMGLYQRGTDDDVPSDHFQQCQNIEFFPGSCRTRKGSSVRYTFTGGANRTRYFEFATSAAQSNIPIIFSMDSLGNFYQDAALLINIPFATDFSAVQFFNKLFITFHDGNVGVGVVYMWDNQNQDFRPIGGARPNTASSPGGNSILIWTLNAGGTGYKVGDTGNIVGGNNDAVYIIDAIAGTGPIIGIAITNPGANYTNGLHTTTPTSGGGSGLVVQIVGLIPTGNGILALSIPAGGIGDGYAVGDTGTIDGPGSGATYIISAVNVTSNSGLGAVLQFHLLNPGTGYVIASGLSTTDIIGTGVGFKANITAVTNPGGGAGSLIIAQDGAATGGPEVELGTYQIAVCYETDSGFLTPPGPFINNTFEPTIYIAPGGLQINLSNIPISPDPHVIARHILVTHADGSEFFFIDSNGGFIQDNTTTTAILDFFNTDLVDSADYLFNVRESVPCGTGINVFSARLVIFGFDDPDESLARFSQSGDPETFDQTVESVIIQKDDGYNIRAGGQIRDQWYMYKDVGIYVTNDNGDDPVNWDVFTVEKAIGAVNTRALSTVSATSMTGAHADRHLIADKSGLYLFDGQVNYPEISFKVADLWQNNVDFTKVDPFIDVKNKRIYILGLLDGTMLVGDYKEGIGSQELKWAVWKLPNNVTNAAILDIATGGNPEFTFMTQDLNIYHFDSTLDLDYGSTPIDSPITFGENTFVDGYINMLAAIKARIQGNGILRISVIGYDALNNSGDFNQYILGDIVFGDLMHRDIQLMSRFMSEKFFIRLVNINDSIPNSNFWLSKMSIFGQEMYASRPPISN